MLRKDGLQDSAVNVSETEITALMSVDEAFVIDPHQMQHRSIQIVDVDRIYVLDAGRVVETGSHDELLQQQGLYAGMYTTQKSEYL